MGRKVKNTQTKCNICKTKVVCSFIPSKINGKLNVSRKKYFRPQCRSCKKKLYKERRYSYRDKKEKVCSFCGFFAINKCQLEVDHIDGDASNNNESNLRIICPNCHSLTTNFKNRNRGSGRVGRRNSYIKKGKTNALKQ